MNFRQTGSHLSEAITSVTSGLDDVLDWIKRQDPTTLLLFLNFFAACYTAFFVLPTMVSGVQEGYDRHRIEFARTLEKELQRGRDDFMKIHSEQRADFFEYLRAERRAERHVEEASTPPADSIAIPTPMQ